MKKLLDIDMYGIPLWLFLAIAVVYAAVVAIGALPTTFIGCIITVYLFGTALTKIGDAIPFFVKYLGGGAFVAMLGASFIKWLNILPESVLTAATTWQNTFDYLNLFVAVVLVGSLLSMNRTVLIKAGIRYFIPVIGGIICTFAVTGLVGAVLGYGFSNAVLFVAAPILGGGFGAGAVPLSQAYAAVMDITAEDALATVTPILNMANILAIMAAGILAGVAKKHPTWTGNGQLMVSSSALTAEDLKERTVESKITHIMPGTVVGIACYMVGVLINKLLFPSIHAFAWTIIVTAILKVIDIIPEEIGDACATTKNWLAGALLPIMMAGVGFTVDFGVILEVCTNPVILILSVVVVVVAVVSTALIGKLVGFYPLESAVTAGLCMANAGGTGDVATLGAYKHMELMPFAAMSSRLGGAILIFTTSIIAPLLTLQ